MAVSSSSGDFAEKSLDELEELVDTAGGVTVGRLIQNREHIHPGTYLGSGKLDELIEEIYIRKADGIVCDDELSPAQLRNLEDILKTEGGKALFAAMMEQMAGGQQAASMLNEATMQMLGSFTLLRMISMAGMTGLNVTKEQLLALNEQLNQIKK